MHLPSPLYSGLNSGSRVDVGDRASDMTVKEAVHLHKGQYETPAIWGKSQLQLRANGLHSLPDAGAAPQHRAHQHLRAAAANSLKMAKPECSLALRGKLPVWQTG